MAVLGNLVVVLRFGYGQHRNIDLILYSFIPYSISSDWLSLAYSIAGELIGVEMVAENSTAWLHLMMRKEILPSEGLWPFLVWAILSRMLIFCESIFPLAQLCFFFTKLLYFFG